MNKNVVVSRLQERYVLHKSLKGVDVKEEDADLHEGARMNFGTFDNALEECGLTKRKLRERERFMIYSILKKRYREHGDQALRAINIGQPDESFKEYVKEYFTTIKEVTNAVKYYTDKSVIYEMHTMFLTGMDETDVKNNEKLKENIIKTFESFTEAMKQYNTMFGVPKIIFYERSIYNKRTESEERFSEDDEEDLLDMLVRLNYFDSQGEANSLRAAYRISKDEIIGYLFEKISEKIGKNGEMLTEKTVKEDNLSMYFAIKAHFGTMEEAVQEATKKYIGSDKQETDIG